jgi:hypothetical protein
MKKFIAPKCRSQRLAWLTIFPGIWTLGGPIACGPDLDDLELELGSSPPMPELVSVSNESVTLPVGQAIRMPAHPLSSTRRDNDDDTRVELISANPGVTQLYPRASQGDFVVIGQRVGKARPVSTLMANGRPQFPSPWLRNLRDNSSRDINGDGPGEAGPAEGARVHQPASVLAQVAASTRRTIASLERDGALHMWTQGQSAPRLRVRQ